MKLSGPAGGCSAEIIDNYEGKITGFYDLSEGDSTDRHDAEGWGNMFNFHNSLKLLQKGKNGRAVPDHCPPKEAWQMMIKLRGKS